ncbi:MAG: nucleotidyltransferase domain-containing protein [Candidatus Pacebacteria bacterium]|jgi:hypothetical protein|nr:nucleotidyltransferase domain-containing protein [Candidatus Paceibacterota bacterium]
MEQSIIEYLKEKYSPRAIILAGSRAIGKETEDSDWDIFVFAEKDYPDGYFVWNNQLLDITIHSWPKPDNWVFTIPFGPLWPVKVLYDDTQGVFDQILKRTKDVYELGPLVTYSNGCRERLDKLERWKGKIGKYKTNSEVQFYYAGIIFEFAIRVWFEQQNIWPLTPSLAVPYIREKDSKFADMISSFVNQKGESLVLLTNEIVNHLRSLRKE